MLTKEQANAASDALLYPGQLGHEADAAKITQHRRLWLWGGFLRRGALLGFALGIAARSWLRDHSFILEIVGFVVGGVAGLLFYHFHANHSARDFPPTRRT